MEIKLDKLQIQNFKGVMDFTFAPAGNNCNIYGTNGAGKTTIKDAFLWLLFGKDSAGKANFALKPLDKDGAEIHNLNTNVSAVLNIDGKQRAFGKSYYEKWTKKRGGKAIKEFTGHNTTDHFIDGVPVQQKEYMARIAGLIDEDAFRLITSTSFFNSLHWQKRRDVVMAVCGGVDDSEVINSDADLQDLPEILSGRSIEDQKKIIAASKKELNKQLTEIPARIDELTKSIAGASELDQGAITKKIKDLEARIQTIKDDAGLAGLRKQKAEVDADLATARTAYDKAVAAAVDEIDKRIAELKRNLRTAEADLSDKQAEKAKIETRIKEKEQHIIRLRAEFVETSGAGFAGESVCPACGQDLPHDQIQCAMETYNTRKANSLAKINKEGKDVKAETNALTVELNEIGKEIDAIETGIADTKGKVATEEANRDIAERSAGQKELLKLTAVNIDLEDIEAKSENYEISGTTDLELELTHQQGLVASITAAKTSETRIRELARQEKALAAEYERLEHETFLMDKFTVKKVEMLEGKINSTFAIGSFKMFDVQVNGGISECCVRTFEGVPYGSGLNTGAEINVGLSDIRTLSEHYGVSAPVFIDHAESVVELIDPGTQTIKLFVSEQHDKMEVVYE